MASAARDNDWQSQPRERLTGRFAARQRGRPRDQIIKLRLTAAERRQIEAAADQAGLTLTRYLIDAATASQRPEEPQPMTALDLYPHLSRKRR